jgi:hypothetical protein
MQTARQATEAHNTRIRVILRRAGSEKTEYLPQNHWNAQYQSQPSPPMTTQQSIHHGLDRGFLWGHLAGVTHAQTSFLITDQLVVKIIAVIAL